MAGDPGEQVLPRFGFLFSSFMRAINAEEFLTQAQFGIAAPVAQDSVVPDLDEPIG